jgi:hypothetical protein
MFIGLIMRDLLEKFNDPPIGNFKDVGFEGEFWF